MISSNSVKSKKIKRRSLEIFGEMLSTFKNRSESDLPKAKPSFDFNSQYTTTNDENQILYSNKILAIQENITQSIFSRKTVVILTIYHNYIQETALNGILLAKISSNLTFAITPSPNSGFNLILKGLNEVFKEITRHYRVRNEAELIILCNCLIENTNSEIKTLTTTKIIDFKENHHERTQKVDNKEKNLEQSQKELFWKESADLLQVCGDNLNQLINENAERKKVLQSLLRKMDIMH